MFAEFYASFFLFFRHSVEIVGEKYSPLRVYKDCSLLLLQLCQRGVGSALQALNSVFFSYVVLLKDMSFSESRTEEAGCFEPM